MMQLENLKPGISLVGIEPTLIATVVAVVPIGEGAVQLLYKTPEGTIKDADVEALCALAKHPKVYVKVGAFYALGQKKPPYTDLAPLIRAVVKAFGACRCMWESDCPFQVVKDRYVDSVATG